MLVQFHFVNWLMSTSNNEQHVSSLSFALLSFRFYHFAQGLLHPRDNILYRLRSIIPQ